MTSTTQDDLIERLEKWASNSMVNAGVKQVMHEAAAELRSLRARVATLEKGLLQICDGSNWPEHAQQGLGYQCYTEITERLHELL